MHWNLLRVLAVLLTGGALTLTGCAFRSPSATYGSGGKRSPVLICRKRYPLHLSVDYVHRFRRQAYCLPSKRLVAKAKDDKAQYAAEWGAPDAVRRPFKSRKGEKVEEWIYLERNVMLQFIGGQLTYLGNVSDLELTLMLNGYPHQSLYWFDQPSNQNVLLTYRKPFSQNFESFYISDGALLQAEEGN
ncbi:hypothetical protein JXA32_13700 [Candidatus Sumerlaeota bacterium]|nr:hypothetical protein [Candidatus Sumerlaeota bacterium]